MKSRVVAPGLVVGQTYRVKEFLTLTSVGGTMPLPPDTQLRIEEKGGRGVCVRVMVPGEGGFSGILPTDSTSSLELVHA